MDKSDWQKKGAGHRQRLREKFLDKGIDSFTDAEVLELILTFGTPRKDCKEPARKLLENLGSFSSVLEASNVELEKIPGVGPKNFFAIHFIHAAARRYLEQRLKAKHYVRSSKQVADFLVHTMRDMQKEILMVIFLDAGHGIIDTETVAEGTLTSNTIHPRELIKRALRHNAAAVVIAHNHPSGNQQPSPEDLRLTRNLFLALSFVSIALLDHFIVAGSQKPYSFADNGLMLQIKDECRGIIQ